MAAFAVCMTSFIPTVWWQWSQGCICPDLWCLLSVQVLLWMVQELLGSSNAMDLELLLIHYCVTRRNPLSSIATIEEALAMVCHVVLSYHVAI